VTAIGPWDAALVLAKAVTYGATLGASGGVMFLTYSGALIGTSHRARLRRLMRILLIVAAAASVAKVAVTAASMSGDMAGLVDVALNRMVLQAGEGHACLVRLIGLLLMGGALQGCRPIALPALSGALAAATSFAWVGHVHALASGSGGNLVGAAGAAAAWLPMLVLGVHLSAAAFWLGALVPLFMIAREAEIGRVAAVAARFGAAALYVVAALLAAGVCLLALLLHNAAELWGSDYGRFILVKLLLVAGLLALAAQNHARLTPRLFASDGNALRALQRSIGLEILLAAAVLLVTAALTTVTGPPSLGLPLP
jgi:putative copper resistance protein D